MIGWLARVLRRLRGRPADPERVELEILPPEGGGRGGRVDSDRPAVARVLPYDEAKALARSPDESVRRELARNPATQPELLVYLAADDSPQVRREIAANAETPIHAQMLLAGDSDDDVRCELARKVGRILPSLGGIQSERVSSMALNVLEKLAQDSLPRVRAMVADEIRQAANVPADLVRELAFDLEAMVSCPILEYSPLLSDADLLEIITTGAVSDRLTAISRRSNVPAPVADAVVATLDVPAVAALLGNPSAQIREETLDTLIDSARAIEDWHQPLVMRAELSVRAIRRVSEFVAASLIATLAERHDLDPALQSELRAMVRKRISEAAPSGSGAGEVAQRKAKELFESGDLDDEIITEALDHGERDFVITALALKSGLPEDTVRRIVATRTATPITALAWKAGLTMRTAMTLQLRLSHVPPTKVLNAAMGVDYPLPPAELTRQLDLFAG
ncbi:MAG: DUF2336 domain-containing protein [Sneathiellaceae bacterium]